MESDNISELTFSDNSDDERLEQLLKEEKETYELQESKEKEIINKERQEREKRERETREKFDAEKFEKEKQKYEERLKEKQRKLEELKELEKKRQEQEREKQNTTTRLFSFNSDERTQDLSNKITKKERQEQERQEQEQKKIERDEIIWEATNCLIASEQSYDSISAGVWGNKLMRMNSSFTEIHPSLRGKFYNLAKIPHYGVQSYIKFLDLLRFSHNQLEIMLKKAIEIKNILENYSQSDYDKDYKEKRAETGGRDGDAQRAILQKIQSFISVSLSSFPHQLINQFSFFCLTPNFKVNGIQTHSNQDMMLANFNYNTVVISLLNRINCLVNFLSKILSLTELSGGLKKRKTRKTKKNKQKNKKTRKTNKNKRTKNKRTKNKKPKH
jgi:hypothetical protein